MKRVKRFISILICLSLLCFSGCTAVTENNKKLIAASFYPVYIFTLNLVDGIDDVEVKCMAEQNVGCLHDYTLTTKDARLISDCGVFIINGAGMEGFVEDLYTSKDELYIIDSSEGTTLLCGEHHHHKEEEGGHHHEYNSHIWMSPYNAKIQIKNIAKGLIEKFPEYEKQISNNLTEYLIRLNDVIMQVENAKNQVSGKKVISFHNAYDYIAEDMGFTVFETIESDEGGEPSAKKLTELTQVIKENEIKALFTEPTYSGSAASILNRETGIEIYVLNPVLNGKNEKTSYEDTMKNNIDLILKAVK